MEYQAYKSELERLFNPQSLICKQKALVAQNNLFSQEMLDLQKQICQSRDQTMKDSLFQCHAKQPKQGKAFFPEGAALRREVDVLSNQREQWTTEYCNQNPEIVVYFFVEKNKLYSTWPTPKPKANHWM